jgi:ribosomal protein L32
MAAQKNKVSKEKKAKSISRRDFIKAVTAGRQCSCSQEEAQDSPMVSLCSLF